MLRSLLLLAFLLPAATLLAQPSDDSVHVLDERVSERDVIIGTIGVEWVNKEAWGGRLFVAGGPQFLQLSPFSWSFVHDPASGKLRFSMNPVFGLGGALLVTMGGNVHNPGPWPLAVLGIAMLIPQVLPNLTLQLPIVPKHVYLAAGQRTDYYLFNNPIRVYSEVYLGGRLFVGGKTGINADVRYVWPISRGFLEDRKPYVGVGLSFAFMGQGR